MGSEWLTLRMGGFRYGILLNRTCSKDILKAVKCKCEVSFLWVISSGRQQKVFGQPFHGNFGKNTI
jgi:hypothetical protein